MEKGIVIYENDVIDFFNNLIFELYKREYFNYLENAIEYVNAIYDFIDNKKFVFPHKKSPEQLIHLGQYYIFYKSNNQTTWFIFFYAQNDEFLITGILNNHSKEAIYFNL